MNPQQITELDNIRPGRLFSTFRKYGMLSSHCTQPDSAEHVPYWILTRKCKLQRSVSFAAVERIRAKAQLYERFRDMSHELLDVNDALTQMKLRGRSVQKNFASGDIITLTVSLATETVTEVLSNLRRGRLW